MAITVVDDFTTITAADAFCCLLAVGGVSALGMCIDTITKAQGSGSAPAKVMCSGLGGVVHDCGVSCTFDLTDEVIMSWAQTLDGVNTCTGWRIRLAGTVACGDTTCYGCITTGSCASTKSRVQGFISLTACPKKPFVNVCATPPP